MGGVSRLLPQLRRRRATRVALASAVLSGALACARLPAPAASEPPGSRGLAHVSGGGPSMGTILEITIVTRDPEAARAQIERCLAEVVRLEAIFTTWRAEGELARLNAAAGRGPQPASPEIVRILRDAQGLARTTDGAFDVTVAPLISLWREAAERGVLPSDAQIATARARVGADRIALDPRRGTLALPAGMSADLGGFAKGWALDRAGELLRTEGTLRALLNFGGSSLLALGKPLDAERWRVAVADGRGGTAGVLGLRDQSASISASFGQASEIAGERYGHIVDPRSGWPIRHAQLAIVVAADGASAEAWSKALVVLPPSEGLARAALQTDVEALVEDATGARAASAGFASAVTFEPLPAPPMPGAS